MPRSYLDLPVPIAAAATAPGEAALALVRASGPGALELAASCFSRPAALLAAPGHSLVHGRLIHPATGEAADEVLASVFRAPRSFTGEDAVEFSCHGSPAALRRVLEALEAAGFAPALPGEFAFRAFANGKSDLVRAEAIDELIRSRSEGAREGALLRLEGGLSRRLESARAALLEVLAEAEIRLDYAEEDGAPAEAPSLGAIAALRDSLAGLAATYRAGRLYRDGVRVALAGRANAGKSSLFNLLLREERSIVSPEAGTTRDWIEAGLELAGFPVRLLDTAGLREASGAVEAEGVARSRRLLAEAELVVYVVDGAAGVVTPEDEAFLAERPEAIRAWNKIDAAGAAAAPAGFVALSAATGEGFPGLLAALEASLHALARGGAKGASAPPGGPAGPVGAPAEAELRVASERQKVLLDRAVAALEAALAKSGAAGPEPAVPEPAAGDARGALFETRLDAFALDLREAADALGEITGEIAAPEILEAIFSRFCLGK